VVIEADGTPLRANAAYRRLYSEGALVLLDEQGSPYRPRRRRSGPCAARRSPWSSSCCPGGERRDVAASQRVGSRSEWAMLSMEDPLSWAHVGESRGAEKNGRP
jgi:hypothetical protein